MSGFGPYRVLRELGRGGMGRVLEVAHPDLPGRRLALKLAPTLDERHLRRFQREVELLGRVRHPGVVAVHASGVADEGPWMVMDLVEGRSLAEALREQGALPPARAGEVALALAEAVAAVHAAGLLHRDLKPANVMLRPDGTPVLVDFGLAWAEDVDRLTRTGAMIGTPTYLAPELLRPTPARPDPRLDVWGLGSILFALLSGHAPFEQGSSFADTVRRIIEEEPRWPAAPAPLQRVLRRALAKRPEDRPPHAGAFADELRQALGELARPPRVPRALLIATTAAALLALGALGVRALSGGTGPAPEESPGVAGPVASVARPPEPVAPPAPARPKWQRLEQPGQPGAAAGAFLPDGSGRLLTWAWGSAARASELVEWRLGPGGAARTGRRWELAQEVSHLALARSVALLVQGERLLRLDLDAPAPELRPLAHTRPAGLITALALQADGERCALGVSGGELLTLLAFRLEPDALRLDGRYELPGKMVTGLVLEPELLVASVLGAVSLNGLELFQAGGRSARVPITTAPTLVTRDPQGELWLATESSFLHRCDPATGLVEQQLEGVAAVSHFEAMGGGLVRAPSHNGAPFALRFTRSPLLGFSASNDRLEGFETAPAPTPADARELRVWEERGGAWRNVGGLGRFPARLVALDVSPDGRWLLLGHGSAVELWERTAIPTLGPEDRRLPAWEEVVARLR